MPLTHTKTSKIPSFWSCVPHEIHMRLIYSTDKERGLEKLNALPKAFQLVRNRAKTQSHVDQSHLLRVWEKPRVKPISTILSLPLHFRGHH